MAINIQRLLLQVARSAVLLIAIDSQQSEAATEQKGEKNVREISDNNLKSLAAWLRCYPVVGREEERKRLTAAVESELQRRRTRRLLSQAKEA